MSKANGSRWVLMDVVAHPDPVTLQLMSGGDWAEVE